MQERKARRNTYAPAAIVFMKIKNHFKRLSYFSLRIMSTLVLLHVGHVPVS